jgi:hypothetical protein
MTDNLAAVITRAWERNGDVPFPLYQHEAEAMAREVESNLFSEVELTILIDTLALAASRRESQARYVKHGRHHDEAAVKMRELRVRFMRQRLALQAASGLGD